MLKIEKLTPEQEALIPVYREKWRAIALSAEPIDRQKAQEAVKAVYAAISKPEPKVLFCDSPQAVPKILTDLLKKQLGRFEWLLKTYSDSQLVEQQSKELGGSLRDQVVQLYSQLRAQIVEQLHWQLQMRLAAPLPQGHEQQLWEQLQQNEQLQQQLYNCISPGAWTGESNWFDFCTSVLNCTHAQGKWLAFKSLVEQCGWILPYEKICIVCDRPIHLSFDNEARLHAEGEPAIQFADGFSIYAYQGVRLPERYGKIHPYQWRSQWLLEESNAELRRVLIQGIGYERIFQELEATELNSWAEYTLLKINADVDEEPILLLKMTCPSTGFIHVSRVPPDVESAKEAIRWMNWEIAPEEFAIQT